MSDKTTFRAGDKYAFPKYFARNWISDEPGRPLATFVDNGDGTATDPTTGLMWVKSVLRMVLGDFSATFPGNAWTGNIVKYVGADSLFNLGDVAWGYNDAFAFSARVCMSITEHTSTGETWEAEFTAHPTVWDVVYASGVSINNDAFETPCSFFGDRTALESFNSEVNNTGYAGYHDWRVPNIYEALSMLDVGPSFRLSGLMEDGRIDPIYNLTHWLTASSGAGYITLQTANSQYPMLWDSCTQLPDPGWAGAWFVRGRS